MRLTEAFVIESAITDAQQRNRASRAYENLLKRFKAIGGLGGMISQRDSYIATQSILQHPDDIVLVIAPKKGGQIDGGFEPSKRLLYLTLDLNRDILTQLQSSQMRTTIVHEFIHLFDSERMRVMRPTRDLPDEEYYNDPSETNAYYQEAIAAFEDMIRRFSPTARELQMRRLQDFEQFLSLVNTMMSDSFTKWVNVKNDQKIKKRLYQYWYQAIRGRS